MEQKTRCGRRYDADLKENAVALVLSGRSIREVARDLGVSTWSLGRWVQKKKQGGVLAEPKTLAAETPAERENRQLRHEIEYLRRQRDILKKALAIVSDGTLSSASKS